MIVTKVEIKIKIRIAGYASGLQIELNEIEKGQE